MEVQLDMMIPSFCGAATGQLHIQVFGGSPPYSISWSNGATTEVITDLLSGTYSVTVIDADLEEVTEYFEVPNMGYTEFYGPTVGPPQSPGWCVGDIPYVYPYAAYPPGTSGYPVGPGPWSFSVNGVNTAVLPNPCLGSNGYPEYYLPLDHPMGSTVNITYTDGNGCGGSAPITISLPVFDMPIPVLSTSGSCNGLSTGSVVVSTPPWSDPPGFNTWGLGLVVRPVGGLPMSTCASGLQMQEVYTNGGVRTFTGLAPGDYELVLRPIDTDPQFVQSDLTSCPFVSFTIPDLGTDCGSVTGRAFMDYNLNCTRQTNEPYVPGGIVEIQPGPVYAIMDAQGLYTVALPTGSYTLEQQSEVLGEHCTGGPIPFTITAGQTSTVNLPDTSAVPMDVQLMMSSGIARPGFEFQYSINVRNLTPAASGATTVTFTSDPALDYLSATPSPSNITGTTITWNQSQLTAWQQRSYTIRFQVPPDVGLLGYELMATANVSTTNYDGNPANNSATNLRSITGAYDPNDKLAYTSGGNTSVWQIIEDEWIDYTIRFQNTGTDTAFNVVITDTLPSNLDPGSIIMGASSHTFSWELRDAGTLKFYYPNIQLPDSNVNEPRSHGFVGFRIRPRLPLLPGDEIENIANIYFDFNDPVITEPSVLVAEFSTGVDEAADGGINVHPNPTSDQVWITVPSDATRTYRVFGADGRDVQPPGVWSNDLLLLDAAHLAPGFYVIHLGKHTARFLKH